MYLETSTKFYEIVTIGKTVYVHFGRIPSLENPQLPFGTFQAFTFTTRKEAIKYMDKKVQEKKAKKYETVYAKETHDMKWMRKNEKPKIKVIRAVGLTKKSNKKKQKRKTVVKKRRKKGTRRKKN